MKCRNIANLLSLSRIALTPPIILFLLSTWQEGYFVAGTLFLFAMGTDVADGYLARRGKGASSLGVFLDLIADKILVLAILVVLVQLSLIPNWMAMVIIAREAVVMALRWGAANKGKVIPAAAWGKGKTLVTSIGIAAVIMGKSTGSGYWGQAVNAWAWLDLVASASFAVMLAATLLTLISGILYLRVAIPIVLAGPRPAGAIGDADQTSSKAVP